MTRILAIVLLLTAALLGVVIALPELKKAQEVQAREARQRAAEERWRDSLRTAGVDRAEGARRTLYRFVCIDRFRAANGGRLPEDSAALARLQGCGNIDGYYRPGRTGWRWRYTVTARGNTGAPSRFLIEEYPDTALGLLGPIYAIDEAGVIFERARPGTSPVAYASPLPALRALRECIAAAGEYVGEVYEQTGREYPVATLADIGKLRDKVCSEVGLEEYVARSGDDSTIVAGPNVAALDLPRGAKGWDVVTRWVLVYEPRGDHPGDGFDVLARPRRMPGTGARSFRLPEVGWGTVTTEHRAARADDPPPIACEMTAGEPCVAP